ncbi:hypothetical protein A2856_01360 [Candidatus Uhrbacteria bacterium RIFCSPHIGHO2_01_FULL_63_20]|uniref:O-antigen ligase-related domain-containing protein n=1 Tax=Candidatus Uhrbacteria bacterium RIFCSPHIGHO2_01_FULL_63_20 TaxID=1802385 RepID=A0A1F7TL90_9BACT|nr:MAG: hypothetical protein A2856_01360 [Candidatus Uhrbacteria bacterium RIFCSPHIGHO2_01_FULL_63_20]
MKVDLKAVYRLSEEHTRRLMIGLFAALAVLVLLQSVFSPLIVLAAVLTVTFAAMTLTRPLWTLAFLAVFLPFEPFLLKFVPVEVYLFARFFSEGLVYALCLVTASRVLMKQAKGVQTPVGLPFVLFLVVLAASALVNAVDPTTAALGVRQIIRFILVFFVAAHLAPPKAYVLRLTQVMLAIVAVQASIGLAQAFIGEPLDALLLPSEARTFGDITLTAGVSQFWDPGSRVFATLGRYDRLGNFLAFFLLIAAAMLYQKGNIRDRRELLSLFALALPALVLTYSRASWFAFLFGFLFIALYLHRDRRVAAVFASVLILAGAYVWASGLNVRFITEAPGQTLVERFYETFSASRWRSEYYGLGRVYWMVQTPITVVPAAPLFGFGPGQFGGGAVSALHDTSAYDRLGLPFGVYGTEGYVDNNWLSLWGETGTIGLAFFLWMYLALFAFAVRTARTHADPQVRALAGGYAAALIGFAFIAMLSTAFEIRTNGYYLWLFGGLLVAIAHGKGKTHDHPAGQ